MGSSLAKFGVVLMVTGNSGMYGGDSCGWRGMICGLNAAGGLGRKGKSGVCVGLGLKVILNGSLLLDAVEGSCPKVI